MKRSYAGMLTSILAVGLLLQIPASTIAAELYVDTTIVAACANYSAVNRSCGGGDGAAYPTFSTGLDAVAAGDILWLRGGQYGQLNVSKSGALDLPITIRGMNGEAVLVTTSSVGINIINQSDIVVADLQVSNVQGFARLEDSSRIEIRNIDFDSATASGTTGSLKLVRSTNNRIIGNSFTNGSDLLIVQDDSDRNVIMGNSFGRASHSLISIRCGSENIIRENIFNNPDQKAMELFDCEGVSDAPVRLDDARRNLIEGNQFNGTAASGKTNAYNAIQHGGQETIVRFNIYQNNLGGGVNYQHYSDESMFVYENRLYNNTFVNNRCYGIIGQSGPSNQMYDNRVVNNLLYQNSSCSGGSGQVSIEDTRSVILSNNSEATSDPGFVSVNQGNFNLLESSREVDAGAFVARMIGTGSGSIVVVDDAGWFYDGFGVSGETGDFVQLEGSVSAVQIIDIDYSSNTITLSSPITWSDQQGLHVAFAGIAPDVGALEFVGDVRRPAAPADLTSD